MEQLEFTVNELSLTDCRMLLGENDEYLHYIEEYFQVSIMNRGNYFAITGEQRSKAKATILALVKIMSKQELTKQEVHEACGMADRMEDERVDRIYESALAKNIAGKLIYPKTYGQKQYVSALMNHDIVFGVGPAGTGKTYLVKALILNSSMSYSLIGLAAPTHKACRVLSNAIGGKKVNTIQSLFGFRLDVDIDNFNPNNPAFSPSGKNKMIKDGYTIARLLIIDEASMLNNKLVRYIGDFCRDKEIKVIFIGSVIADVKFF